MKFLQTPICLLSVLLAACDPLTERIAPTFPQGTALASWNMGNFNLCPIWSPDEQNIVLKGSKDEEYALLVVGNEPEAQLARQVMVAHIEATFSMKNQGKAAESMEVWFPLSSHDGGAAINAAENFQVWVDGTPVSVEKAAGRDLIFADRQVPWARWPVTFPPGTEGYIRAAYDIRPVGYQPWGTFTYILETGAGWYGPIGEGTVTFQLPYPVNELNTELAEAQARYAGDDSAFDGLQVKENTLTITFSDLEPGEKDNLRLSVLSPALWEKVAEAFSQVRVQSNSVEAQKRLAQALEDAVRSRGYWLVESSSSRAIAGEIQTAYRRAMELAPQDIEVRIACLEWLERYGTSLMANPAQAEPVLDELESVLDAAMQNAPGDPRLAEFRGVGDFWRKRWQELDGVPAPTTIAAAETKSTSSTIATLLLSGVLGLGVFLMLFWLLKNGHLSDALSQFLEYVKKR